ncbi:MAG: hypothetical protein ABIK28_05930, partial [Planctomycetota bacterium]
GPEFTARKPEGTRRIAVIGDSFVFGWGADDAQTLPAHMQAILDEYSSGADRFEVINCGVPGYHAGQMKERLQRKVFGLDPDLLVLVVTANDLVKDPLHFNTLFSGLYADLLPLPYAWKPALWRMSVFYRFAVQSHKSYMEQSGQVAFSPDVMAFFSDQIHTIKREAEQRGIPFLLVILPILDDFYHYKYAPQHEEMHRILADIDYLDLLPLMKVYDVRDLWFTYDKHHLNGTANLMVTRMILGALEARGMIGLKAGALPAEPFMNALYEPGDLVVADMDADPMERGGFPGAIFRVNPKTGEISLISSEPLLREPVDLLLDSNKNLLVLDALGDPLAKGAHGVIYRINRFSGRSEVIVTSDRFGFPNAMLLGPDDRLYISDKESDPLDLKQNTGALWVYDMKTRKLDLLAAGPDFISPSPIAFAPDNKLYLIDADANPNHYEGTPGVLFQVDRTTGVSETLINFSGTVSPVGIISLKDGRFVVVDANADPLGLGYYLGGLLMVDPVKKTTEFLVGSRKFMDPVRGDLGEDGCLYFADGNADPLKLGPDGGDKGVEARGHGAIFRYDMEKDTLTVVASDRRFMNPACVKVVR